MCNPRNRATSTIPKKGGTVWSVGEVFDLLVHMAWQTGEPGVVFIDRVTEANPTPHIGVIEALNACGEQPLLPYESCNLGSINLARFVIRNEKGVFDYDRFRQVIPICVRFLDNVIDANHYPLPELDQAAKGNRKVGLGPMGFASALLRMGIPYDSEEAVAFGEQIMQILNEESHIASQQLAEERGSFPNWEGSVWQQRGKKMRNASVTCVAPTGTISIISGCSGGIEPLFGLAFRRRVLDGKQVIDVTPEFEECARQRGVLSAELLAEVVKLGSIRSLMCLPEDIKRLFVTAHDVAPRWHVRMQAAFQKHCDASISKTVNLPSDATEKDVRSVILQAYQEKCKGITVYRHRCREDQPMDLGVSSEPHAAHDVVPAKLPEVMPAVRVKQVTPFGNMHVTVVVEPDTGREREVFATLGRGGDLVNADLEATCRLTSLFLRANGLLRDVHAQLEGIGSSLSIPSKDGRIASVPDGLAKALGRYMDMKKSGAIRLGFVSHEDGCLPASAGIPATVAVRDRHQMTAFKIKCPNPDCGSTLVFEEACVICKACGYSEC